ncbi:MAG: site-2 protease family protein [Bryobacter sp.]|nr:site-2 protease family protein [Bryobacter sp.]
MPGSIRLFVISGIPVRLHFSFLILIAFLAFLSFSGKDALMEALVILTLFGCVILHELGHAMVARLYGVRTLEIVMFLIGGVARLERAMKPREELWVALAGPAVNIFIAASLFGLQSVLGNSNFLSEVMMLNLGLAAFNMLPAFPMDGGRVLRSILSMFFEDLKATQIAAAVGRILAVAMGIFAIWQGPLMLLLVAFFVFTGAQQEYMGQKSNSLMKGAVVKEAMIRNFISLPHGSTFQQAAEQLLDTSQQEFPVVHGNQPLGLLRRDALLTGLAQHGPDSYISSAMERDFLRVSPNDALEDILTQLAAADYTALVMEDEELIGLLTQENLNEFLVLRNLGHRRPLAAPSIEAKPIDS